MTFVILGAGDLGAATAYRLALADVCQRIVLVDDAANVAAGKALDMRQSAPVEGFGTGLSGTADLSVVVGASAIVLADRAGAEGEWQGEAGLALVKRVHALNPRAPIVCAGTNQITLIEQAVHELGLPARRIFGSAAEALRAAAVSLAALEAGCAPGDVSLCVLGRPPKAAVVPWDAAAIGGSRLLDVLDPPRLSRLDAWVAHSWPTGPLTLAAAATRLLQAAFTQTHQPLLALAARGDDGPRPGPVSIWPVRLSPSGIQRIDVPALTPRDQTRVTTVLQA